MNKTLIIGAGEIGKSLKEVLDSTYEVHLIDKDSKVIGQYDVINICYPYSKDFVKITKDYIKKYSPKLTIIHSTVPVGTTRKIGAVHSPVNGRHPNLAKSILTFVKFIGANNAYDANDAHDFLSKAGIKVIPFASSEATELAKIMCTTRLGMDVIYMKEMIKLCDKYNVPFNQAYKMWTANYNKGYLELGDPKFMRPILVPMRGEIGGHCVLNNAKLMESYLTKIVRDYE